MYGEKDEEDSKRTTMKKEGYAKDVYYGEFEVVTQNPKTIKRHGRGIMFYKKGNAENMIKYVGDWKDDKFDGSGILELYGGAKYDGEWSQGKREGKGVERTENNSIYNGYWRANKRHGFGKYKDSNSFTYKGNYKRGKRCG